MSARGSGVHPLATRARLICGNCWLCGTAVSKLLVALQVLWSPKQPGWEGCGTSAPQLLNVGWGGAPVEGSVCLNVTECMCCSLLLPSGLQGCVSMAGSMAGGVHETKPLWY